MKQQSSGGQSAQRRLEQAKKRYEDAYYKYGPDAAATRLAQQEVVNAAKGVGITMEDEGSYSSFWDRIWPDNVWHLGGISGPGKKGDEYRNSQTPSWTPSGSDAQRRQSAEYRNRDQSRTSTQANTPYSVPGTATSSPANGDWRSDPRQDVSGRDWFRNGGGGQTPQRNGRTRIDPNAAEKGKGPGGGQSGSQDRKSAYEWMATFFTKLGLPEIARVAVEATQNAKNPSQAYEMLRATPEYAARFPGLIARSKAGMPAISEADYLSQERAYSEILSYYGLPKGFYDDPSDFANWIANDVTPGEINERAGMAARLAANADPNLKQALKQYYGVTDGDMTAYFLDRKRTTTILERQVRAAEIGAETLRSGILKTGRKFAEGLVDAGVDAMQTRAALDDVADEVDTVAMLGSIEGTKVSAKDQVEARLGIDNKSDQKVRGLKSRERARFGGSSGGTRVLGGPDAAGSF